MLNKTDMHYALLNARKKALQDVCDTVRNDDEFSIAEKAVDLFYDRIIEEIKDIDKVVVPES